MIFCIASPASVVIGNVVAFTQTVNTKAPLLARMRYQYCVVALKPVCVSVVTFGPTVAVARPCVNRELVARWIVKPVSLLELSAQVRITERDLFLIGPFTGIKLLGASGSAGTKTGAETE